MGKKILSQNFFNQRTLKVAENLLGKFLVRRICVNRRNNQRKSVCREAAIMITEIEAYDGFNDRASHASRGKTERNKIMFEKAGKWYVYFTYGMHWMLNIVTGPKDYPAAILIRGGIINESGRNSLFLDGPAKLTKFLKINKKFNGEIANKKTGLWIEDRGIKINKSRIIKLKRIGVEYAGKTWANKPYRFLLRI